MIHILQTNPWCSFILVFEGCNWITAISGRSCAVTMPSHDRRVHLLLLFEPQPNKRTNTTTKALSFVSAAALRCRRRSQRSTKGLTPLTQLRNSRPLKNQRFGRKYDSPHPCPGARFRLFYSFSFCYTPHCYPDSASTSSQ